MMHPFKNLGATFNALYEALAPARDEHTLKKRFEGAVKHVKNSKLYTPLERDIVRCHRMFRNDPHYHALFVSIRPDPAGEHRYKNPLTGNEEQAEVLVNALQRHYTLENGVRLKKHIGASVVMALDIRKPPEEQIRGWKPGTLVFPGEYLASPLITVPDPEKLLAASAHEGIVSRYDLERLKDYAAPKSPVFLKDDVVAHGADGAPYRAPVYIRGVIKREP